LINYIDMIDNLSEKQRQDMFPWSRTKFHSEYNKYLAYYKVVSCLENAHGDSLLDMPCGDGLLTKMFTEKFKRVVGVDASHVHLEEAKKLLPGVDFYEALIEDFELDEKFDSVFMLDILEHVVNPVELLKKAATFMKDDGVMIVHVPNSEAINRKINVEMGTLKSCDELSPFDINVAGHRRSYTLETLEADIIAAGLEIKKTGGIFLKMLSTPQMDWFLKNGEWESGHGWGREGVVGVDWKSEFCRSCYEVGKDRPKDCNVIFACITKPKNVDAIDVFEKERVVNIERMRTENLYESEGVRFMEKTAPYKYTYNFTWLGRPIIQFPQDMIAMQELIYKIKPDLIIETGIAHGGSLIYYASLLELNGKGKVLGIDIDIREHNRYKIEAHPMSKRIEMLQGSSIDRNIVEIVENIVSRNERIMVVLDSNHTHAHVAKELELYSNFVTKDSYLVVFDTAIEDVPQELYQQRGWGKGNNPKTAVHEFLTTNNDFEIDRSIQSKLLITVAPDGYLKRIK
jgi:cephalosporin hydroxylase/2-polyprenyl-3-methyl-5-hydroxy-6-metoxy-1,4-benzoquinol methylase